MITDNRMVDFECDDTVTDSDLLYYTHTHTHTHTHMHAGR